MDIQKEFEKFCPKGIGQCKVLNTEDPCDVCHLVWDTCATLMSDELKTATSRILELEQKLDDCHEYGLSIEGRWHKSEARVKELEAENK